ncbi:malate synthase G [Basilea psittacipulmonis]|uniref:Malate synthase G n=1 Tax=Basilea psittacipulmonis DSM 24701 TaxID=1072685 RepID=A0A077DEH1_9BURK|nr:malate synthase G [Basilea psittacipulmonis]AIL33129.1 malate synthase [Basilea psittacipulmonis DSM 24701]
MTTRIQKGALAVDKVLYDFIEQEALPVAKIDSQHFWQGFEALLDQFTQRNKDLLAKREEIQAQIDAWHKEHQADLDDYDKVAYKKFLTELGYIEPEVADFQIDTQCVDEEIATIAGPQLVVPVRNARYSLNAANARWGSLYDALYGFDVIPETDGAEKGKGYNPVRGAKVIEFAKHFLDEIFPLTEGSHQNVTQYTVSEGKLIAEGAGTLKNTAQLVGYNGTPNALTQVVLKNNGLHVLIEIDRQHPIGQTDKAGVKDITLEAAVTTIQDLEDSVAAVDAQEKVEGYRNWLGLMKGDLVEEVHKGDKVIQRRLNADRQYIDLSGNTQTLHGRSVMLLRNVGHLMTNPAVKYHGEEVFEGLMDSLITPLLSLVDLRKENTLRNSRAGSMYIVKPKMHGSAEVAFAVEVFSEVEKILGLPANTIKVGIMDEERRTSVNLKNCIEKAKERTIFINTGFMDRTGDEIHTSMYAGAFVKKGDIKQQIWFKAYEDRNVQIGLKSGLRGKAQIGKGMWPKPDELADMYRSKIEHPEAGASCAWVPSPSGATIHAIHYHQCSVLDRQESLLNQAVTSLDDLLTIPLSDHVNWTQEEKTRELENNCQGILGYVVRWVDLGIGCSKVPDINNVGLMEDRATLRISSQHVANWLKHGVVTESQVWDVLKRMAKVVDEQNAGEAGYRPMSADYDNSIAFQAAADLIFKGDAQPSGYTEPILHAARLKLKGYQGD